MEEHFQTLADFWPFYLRQHTKPATRAIHYVGSIGSVVALLAVIASSHWWWLLAVPVCGYGPAWIGHFFIEKNRPATFQAPYGRCSATTGCAVSSWPGGWAMN